MRAYFAMLWDDRNPIARQSAEALQAQIEAPPDQDRQKFKASGLTLYDMSENAGQIAIVSGGEAGRCEAALFGTVFDQFAGGSAQRPLKRLSEATTTRLHRSEGQAIVTDLWGSYIAFVQSGASFNVIADPTASLPCFYMRQGEVTLVFSHLEKCGFIDKHHLSVNYDFLSSLLAYDKIQTSETGLNEIHELPGGYRLQVTPSGFKTDCLWDPRKIAANVYEPPLDQAADELRVTTQAVVQSQAAVFDKITVNLSGGLDSAIVLACLARNTAGIEINAVHRIMASSDVPEDHFAQVAADAAGCQMLKLVMNPDVRLPGAMEHPQTVRPHRSFVSPSFLTTMGEATSDLGTGLFTGQGGDHLFLHSRSILGFADYLRRHRLSGQLSSELLNAARLSGKSIWQVLREALPYVTGKPPANPFLEAITSRRNIVNQRGALERDIGDNLPAWMIEPMGLPPAKFEQVTSLMNLFQVRDMLDQTGKRQTVHPLVAQPLIELCLRLPTYLLCAHGRSRGLARMAFRGAVPDIILDRMTKGGVSRYLIDSLDSNRATILANLMDGELVRCGLIQRSDIEAFFRKDRYRLDESGWRIIILYGIESWLSRWTRWSNS